MSNEQDAPIIYNEIVDIAASQTDKPSPQEVSESFFEMIEQVQQLKREEIENMNDDEILKLGKSVISLTENTVKLGDTTLQKLSIPLHEFTNSIRTMSRGEHKSRSREIEQIMASDRAKSTRNLAAEDIRELLLKFNGGATMMASTCEDLFNVSVYIVTLVVGDNFNVANSVCPANSYFVITQGTHTGQSVSNSNPANYWVGTSSSVMDGQNSVNRAFYNGMTSNFISGFTIKRYNDYGIHSTSGTSNVDITNMIFNQIGDGKDGQYFGAIHFEYSEDINVSGSYFENVASSVRFKDSTGPLIVSYNEALNPGRDFFQCVNCKGEGEEIIISENSIEHNSQYGTEKLEDIINLYRSEGTSTAKIQVHHNRARTDGTGNGVSEFGSFIMLGDHGGEYQEATDNIGVNPGQAGIGSLGGEYMTVEDNKMYSDPIEDISNVAFSSYNFCREVYGPGHTCGPCTNHQYSGNVAHWYCNRGNCGGIPTPVLNKAHAPGSSGSSLYCGLTLNQIKDDSRVLQDTNMEDDVWDEW